MTTILKLRSLFAPALVAAFLGAGCHSMNGPGTAGFASVIISGKTDEQVRATTVAVFREQGYHASAKGRELIFQKAGTQANSLARDGLVATSAGAVTQVRVRAEVVQVGGDSLRLQGQAFMVSGAGDAFFEDETPLANIRRGPYQALFDEVARRLQ